MKTTEDRHVAVTTQIPKHRKRKERKKEKKKGNVATTASNSRQLQSCKFSTEPSGCKTLKTPQLQLLLLLASPDVKARGPTQMCSFSQSLKQDQRSKGLVTGASAALFSWQPGVHAQ
jgi:hypothetical protein